MCCEITLSSVTQACQARHAANSAGHLAVLFLLPWNGVWPLGKNVVAETKTEIKRATAHSLSELRKSSFLSHTQPLYWTYTTYSLLCNALRLFFLSLSATWPLKESDEFTADSLWLRRAESSVGWHYRKWLHIDTKKRRHKQKENTMAHFSQYKLMSAWITLMTPDIP